MKLDYEDFSWDVSDTWGREKKWLLEELEKLLLKRKARAPLRVGRQTILRRGDIVAALHVEAIAVIFPNHSPGGFRNIPPPQGAPVFSVYGITVISTRPFSPSS